MSVEAISQAFAAPVHHSSAKFVLVAMANLAGADLCCWPSVAYLERATSQDRKTVLKNIERLTEQGLVIKTGSRRGNTGSVPVYRLRFDQIESDRSCPENDQEFAYQKPSQKRDGLKAGFDHGSMQNDMVSSTVFPCKQSQKRDSLAPEAVPKTGQLGGESSTVFPDKQSRFSAEAVPFFRGSSPKNGTQTLKDTKGHEIDTPPQHDQEISTEAKISIELRKRGVSIHVFNPKLIEAVKQGVTVDLMLAAFEEAKTSLDGAVPKFNYLLAILTRWAAESKSLRVVGAKANSKASARQGFDVLAHNNRHRMAQGE